MARYQVDAQVGATRVLKKRIRAASAEGAHQIARGEMFLNGVDPSLHYWMTVLRRGLRRPVVAYAGGRPPGDGPDPAGVREPRRPTPPPPALRRARDEPG